MMLILKEPPSHNQRIDIFHRHFIVFLSSRNIGIVDNPNAPVVVASFHPVCLAQNIDSPREAFENGFSVGYLFVASFQSKYNLPRLDANVSTC